MKRILSFLACIVLVASPFTIIGCKSTPNQVAYQSAKTLTTSVSVAMSAWYDWLVAEEHRVATLPPIEQGPRRSELIKMDGKVRVAYGEYQTAMRASEAAVTAALGSGQRLPEHVGVAALEVLKLIDELKR